MVIDKSNNSRISINDFNKEVQICRYILILLIILITNFLSIDKMNIQIESIYWKYLYNSKVFKFDSFEVILSSVLFAFYISVFYIIDHYIPRIHKYRINPTNDMSSWVNKNNKEKALLDETLWYLVPWVCFDYLYPRRILPNYAPNIYEISVDIVLSLLIYDALFFIGHYILHHNEYLYKKIHYKHHSNHIIHAKDSIRHTFLDGIFDVMCSVIALNITNSHPISRSLFNVIAIYLITEAHSGVLLPMMPCCILPNYLLSGPKIHNIHHIKGKVNYQKFFTYIDVLFNTFYSESKIK
jgi:cholesterol 25-hydroxylase